MQLVPRIPPLVTAAVEAAAGVALRPARVAVGRVARSALAGPPTGQPELAFADAEDPGLFGPGSMTWRVHRDRSMVIGGLRALLLQVMHPLAMAGVAQHSAYREDPLGRLARTGRFVASTTYGTTPEAHRAIAKVRGIHGRVEGTAADGRSYSANDPALLAWVHNVEVDSFLAAFRRYGPEIRAAEADQYVAEMAGLGRRLGAIDVPETEADLRDWIASVPGLAVSADARDAVRFLVLPNLPVRMLPTYGVVAAAAIDLLPGTTRRALGLVPLPLVDPLIVRPTAAALLGLLGWALGPAPLPRG